MCHLTYFRRGLNDIQFNLNHLLCCKCNYCSIITDEMSSKYAHFHSHVARHSVQLMFDGLLHKVVCSVSRANYV